MCVNYFDDFIDTLDDKGNNKNIDYSKSIFIDDNPLVIDDLYSKNPKKIIRIRRDKAKYSNIDTVNKVMEVDCLDKLEI